MAMIPQILPGQGRALGTSTIPNAPPHHLPALFLDERYQGIQVDANTFTTALDAGRHSIPKHGRLA